MHKLQSVSIKRGQHGLENMFIVRVNFDLHSVSMWVSSIREALDFIEKETKQFQTPLPTA